MRYRALRRSISIASASGLSLAALLTASCHALGQQAQQPPVLTPVPNSIPVPPVTVVAPEKPQAAPKAAPSKKAVAPQIASQPAPKPAPKPASSAPKAATQTETATPSSTRETPNIKTATGAALAAAKLDTPSTTGSQLNLALRETPATVNVVTQQDIAEKGSRSLIEIYRSVPGVFSGNLPGEPGVTSIRGFSRAGVGLAIDGSRVVDPIIVSRDYDSFNFERVEILKGPGSVVSGTYALAGTINLFTKQAILGKTEAEGMVSYGSFGTVRTGVGFNAALSPQAAIRSTLSYSKSNGYIDDTDWDKFAVTNSIVLNPSPDLKLTGAVDYFHDNFKTSYQGTPLVSAATARDPSDIVKTTNGMVIDRAMRNANYNVADGVMKSDTLWLRGKAEYKLSSNWTLKNELGYYDADRLWANSEDFTFNSGTGKLDRTTTKITHDHQFWSERATASYDGSIGGFRNRFVAGLEYMDTQLNSQRRFGTTTSVDPYNPVRGYFPADTAANFSTRQKFTSSILTTAAFAENAINLTPDLIVVGGIRREKMELDRQIDNLNTGAVTLFNPTFETTNWRVGSVWEFARGHSLFGQYTQAATPITTLLLSNLANSKFNLSTGESKEAGIKSAFFDNKLVTTIAAYQIDQDDILTRDAANPAVTIQGGSQRSRGIEADASLDVTRQWNVAVSGTLIDAEYTSLRTATRNLAGNRPVNVPDYALTVSSSYRFSDLPMSIGASVNRVGGFFTDTTNTIEVAERTLLDAWVSYDIGKGTFRLRGRNLTNEFYADWSGYSATQVYLGAPRSFDVSYDIKW